jgi:hypothetical protein
MISPDEKGDPEGRLVVLRTIELSQSEACTCALVVQFTFELWLISAVMVIASAVATFSSYMSVK